MTADSGQKVYNPEHVSAFLKNIGAAWVDPDAVDYNGYLTSLIKPLIAKSSYYWYDSAGPESPLPGLQMEESSRNCQDSFHFRSKMYCKNERDCLILPYKVRSMMYAYAFAGKGEHSLKLLKILPTVCHFVYVDIATFINRDHFQLYFRQPLTLHTYLKRLDMTRSPVLKTQLNLRRLRCVILDLDRRSNVQPKPPPRCAKTTPEAVRIWMYSSSYLRSRRFQDLV
jgi:hypothetical protein